MNDISEKVVVLAAALASNPEVFKWAEKDDSDSFGIVRHHSPAAIASIIAGLAQHIAKAI